MTQWGLDTLFNPAKRHMDEEKRRLMSTREEVGDSSGGKRIDLESGKVTIRRSGDEGDESTDAPEPADAAAPPRRARASSAKDAAKTGEPSAAAKRAAARRRRQAG